MEDGSLSLADEGRKIFIPSMIFDIWTKLEVLVVLRLSGLTDTLREASNLIDELFERGQKSNENIIETLLINFELIEGLEKPSVFLNKKLKYPVNLCKKLFLITDQTLKSICWLL